MVAATEWLGLYDAELKALRPIDDKPTRCTGGKVHDINCDSSWTGDPDQSGTNWRVSTYLPGTPTADVVSLLILARNAFCSVRRWRQGATAGALAGFCPAAFCWAFCRFCG
jgi:hypothetical protein